MIVLALYVCMILKAGQKKVARGYTGFDLSFFFQNNGTQRRKFGRVVSSRDRGHGVQNFTNLIRV